MTSAPPSQPKDSYCLIPIGETGTGKTTLINSFANYSRYATLDEAIENGPAVLADVGFSYSAAGVRGKPIYLRGSTSGVKEEADLFEVTPTQSSSVYLIDSNDSEELVFYDNPGFGSQSLLQGEKIKRPIHVICIVLKPDETRLHTELRTFLKTEGKPLVKNIVYCFTNTRAHSFQPAATLTTLRDFLLDLEGTVGVEFPTKKRNIFCFENDCFRYLCHLAANPGDQSRHHKVYAKEWTTNVEEYKRLVSHVKTLTLHEEVKKPGFVMAVENNSETLPFLNGQPEDVKEKIKSTIMNDQEISKKIQRIKKLLGDNSLFDDWMQKVTCQTQLAKLSCAQQGWNPENFHHVVSCISQLTTKEAEQFFSFCRLNVVNKLWPEEYAMDLAKLTLTDDAKTVRQPENEGDSSWEKIDGHEHSLSIPGAPESDQQPENLNDLVPGPEEISTSKIEAAEREPDPKDSLTIVFMGMSGNGKTTMVNGIANSFRYETFDKALKSGPRVVLPTRFTTFVGSKVKIVQPALTINSQSQSNENLNDGSGSVTKNPIIHEFSYNTAAGKIPVRIVDTPGLNDTEGYDTDCTNLAKTFAFLEKLDKIDSICIVLKANEPRLTFSLNSALKQLLKRLQRSTYKNVSFVFTYGKTPGESLALLRENFKDAALNTDKENWFAFDNEPFRYLCTVRQYSEAANEERKEECQELFDHNVEELKRLLERAQCLPSFKMLPVSVEKKEVNLGQALDCDVSTSDKIGSGTSSIGKTLWRTEQGPSTTVSMIQESSLAGVPVNAVPVHYALKQADADKEEDLRTKEKIEHDRTCRIVVELSEPLAQQIFDNYKQILKLSDQIDQKKDRGKKEVFVNCRSCNGYGCSGQFNDTKLCRDCNHHRNDHITSPRYRNELDASVAMKMFAQEVLERENNVLHSACHHFSFFSTTNQQHPFLTSFENKMSQLERGLDMNNNDEVLLSHSIISFLTDFRRNIENGQAYGASVTVESTKKKLAELKQLNIFGPCAAQIINRYHP